jgi:hypothetical protein
VAVIFEHFARCHGGVVDVQGVLLMDVAGSPWYITPHNAQSERFREEQFPKQTLSINMTRSLKDTSEKTPALQVEWKS